MPRKSFPLSQVYRLLEPGPVVMVTTARKGRANIMTMSWHTMIDFEPPIVGCVISDRNYTFGILKATKECVINIPTVELAAKAVGCGNTSGRTVDKFKAFGLTPAAASLRQGAAHRRVLCQSRMQGRRCEDGDQVQLLHPRGAQGVDRPLKETPADDPSSRERRLHGCRQDDQVAFQNEIAFLMERKGPTFERREAAGDGSPRNILRERHAVPLERAAKPSSLQTKPVRSFLA